MQPNLNGKVVKQDVAREWQAIKAAAKSNHNTLAELVRQKLAEWSAIRIVIIMLYNDLLCYDNITVFSFMDVFFKSRLSNL